MALKTVKQAPAGAGDFIHNTEATGLLADTHKVDGQPALIVNQEASPCDLVAWCWGEAYSLHETARLVGRASPDDFKPADLHALFLHRLGPLEQVLQLLVRQLDPQRRAQAAH